MPKFDLDVHVDDFMDELSKNEIIEVIDWLKCNNYSIHGKSEVHEDLRKISDNYFRLTLEEEELIRSIANIF